MAVNTTPSPKARPIVPPVPWVVRHWQQVLIAAAAVVVSVILTALVVHRLKEARERGWESLSMAMSAVSQGQRDQAIQIVDQVLVSNRSGALAVQAHLMRADLLLSAGKKVEAVAAFREAQRQSTSAEYKALATISLAYALDESAQTAASADEYARFIADFPDHFLVARAYAQLARLQVSLGKPAEAKATYEKLITLYPSTVWAQDAKQALDALNRAR